MKLSYFDPLDFFIVSELKKDAQTKLSEIAQKAHVNERTVRRRLDKLVEYGVVEFALVVNASFFGYVLVVDIFLRIAPGRLQQIEQRLLEVEEIFYMAEGPGGDELSIQCRFRNNAALFDFLHKKLPSIEGLEVKGYALIPNVVKAIHQWLPKEEVFLQNMAPAVKSSWFKNDEASEKQQTN